MSWRSLTIGELVDSGEADIQTGPFGTQLKASDYVEDGTPVINVRNIGYGGLKPEKLEFVKEETAERLATHLLAPRDIVFGRKGAVDRHLYVSEDQDNWMQGSDCIRLRFFGHDVVPRFVSYAFLTDAHQKWMLVQSGNKATMASLNHDIIKRISLRIPSPSAQESIVEILSNYDDLIENNRRRMALLEEAARQLYREWFVHLRFPGHEHTPITKGVPEGWENRDLAQCISVLETGNRPKGGVSGVSEGIPSIGAESIVGAGQFDFSKTKYVPEAYFSKLKKGVVQDRDVLVYKDGGRPGHFTPHVSMFGGGFPFDKMALNSHVYRLRGALGISQEFLYYHLSSDPMLSWMNTAGSGAAIPGIARKDLLRLPVLVPSNHLMEMFTEMTSNGMAQILKLALATKKLQEARDLLLPRLMNGEITV